MGRNKRQLSMSGTMGAPPQWNPSDSDWAALERAYFRAKGECFSAALKTKIGAAVNSYLWWYSRTPPLAKPFVEKLAEAHKLARKLDKVVRSMGEPRGYLARHWQRYFPDEEREPQPTGSSLEEILAMPVRRGRKHRDIEEVIHTIQLALDDTIREVNAPDMPEYSAGIWDGMVYKLSEAFQAGGLKVTHDNSGGGMSAFPRFVRALLGQLPEKYRVHNGVTDATLSKYVGRAASGKDRGKTILYRTG